MKKIVLLIKSLILLTVTLFIGNNINNFVKANAISNLNDSTNLECEDKNSLSSETDDIDTKSILIIDYDELEKQIIRDNNKSDDKSLVAVFLSDGFTENEKSLFYQKVSDAANYMLTVRPFNYYAAYIKVYAVFCPSKQSRLSGELNGEFACRKKNGEPATTKCTPENSKFKCEHGRDTYFGGYYHWLDSEERVILGMTDKNRDKARKIAKKFYPNVDMIQVIGNSELDGGVASYPSDDKIGIAFSSIYSSDTKNGSWLNTTIHEFGHSFGNLADEYWTENKDTGKVNISDSNNIDKIKWKKWMGYDEVGIYPIEKETQTTKNSIGNTMYYRPSQKCRMSDSEKDFCPVCMEEVAKKIEQVLGQTLFQTTNIGENAISIDKINLEVYGIFFFPERIDGRIVTTIGNGACSGALFTVAILPNTILYVGSEAFKNCPNLESAAFPNGVSEIKNATFENCPKLTSFTFGNNITTIGENAFKDCVSLIKLDLNYELSSIERFAFKNCSKLSTVILPKNLLYIGEGAFSFCSELQNVYVKRYRRELTSIAENTFENSNKDFNIFVNANRICDYKNKENWILYRENIKQDPSTSLGLSTIDCKSEDTIKPLMISGENKTYKLMVNCSKSYKIIATCNSNIKLTLYDSNMNRIEENINTIERYLSWGLYYLSVEHSEYESKGSIVVKLSPKWVSKEVEIFEGENDLRSNLHNTKGNICHGDFYFDCNFKDTFLRFYFDNNVKNLCKKSSIRITSSDEKNHLRRYPISSNAELSVTSENENSLFVYSTRKERYYIKIELYSTTLSSIPFFIEEIEKNTIDFSKSLYYNTFEELFALNHSNSYFKEITLNLRSRLDLSIVTDGDFNDNIPVYVLEKRLKKGGDENYKEYDILEILIENITRENRSPIFDIILDPGVYYIGYGKNDDNISISFGLERVINQKLNIDGVLVTDPAFNQGFELGSEVTFNKGLLRGNTITEGFTRNIYLMVENRLKEPMSRLEYDWYSTDESIATVTNYGTVLALSVDNDMKVIICAINKQDPSMVYKKEFTIKKETSTDQLVIECNMSFSYSKVTGLYTLELNFTNSPYPYLAYYVWDIECNDGSNISMTSRYLIYSSGPGKAEITANYILNRRIFLLIHLTILE